MSLVTLERVREAIRAVLVLLHQSREVEGGAQTRVLDLEAERDALRDRIVELEEMGRAWQESDEHQHADELRAGIEAAWREVDLARAERDALRTRDAVLALHDRRDMTIAVCRHCGREWPCPTRRALEGKP